MSHSTKCNIKIMFILNLNMNFKSAALKSEGPFFVCVVV